MTSIVKDSRKLLNEYKQWRQAAVKTFDLRDYKVDYPRQFKQTYIPKQYVLHAYELPKGEWELGTFRRYKPKKFDIVGFDLFPTKESAQKYVYKVLTMDGLKPFDIERWQPPKGGFKFKPYALSGAEFEK